MQVFATTTWHHVVITLLARLQTEVFFKTALLTKEGFSYFQAIKIRISFIVTASVV
jgi:hypothetical protein